jgi:hypothetical protein
MNILWQSAVVAGILTGCTSLSTHQTDTTALTQNTDLKLFQGYSIIFADIVQVGMLASAVYVVSDPSAPNWEITETRMPGNRVLYNLKMHYHKAGHDDARYVVAQRAKALAHEQGFGSYQIDKYEETDNSNTEHIRRSVFAEVQLLATVK